MAEYVKRPDRDRSARAVAAVYRFGAPLDGLLKVARRADPDAEVVEVPAWRLLLVRHTIVPDHHPSYTDYEVVEDGHVLVYSDSADVLYADDVKGFEREWVADTEEHTDGQAKT